VQLLVRRWAGTLVPACTAGVALVLAIATWSPFPELARHPIEVGPDVPPAYRWLRAHGDGGAVLELPRGDTNRERARRAYLSTVHWHPIIDGYAANAPGHVAYLQWIARRLPAAGALQQIVDLVDVKWILLHRDLLEPARAAAWDAALPDGLRKVAEWGSDAMYEVTLPAADDRRARLLSTTETIRGTPIEPIHGRCAGSIDFEQWFGEPFTASADVAAQVALRNRSERAWPAFGFLPRGLVALEAAIVAADGRPVGDPWTVRPDDDVVPGQPLPSTIRFKAPQPGDYVLRLRLVQNGRRSLDDCVPPLRVPFTVVADSR
jgi:hypothetical protein